MDNKQLQELILLISTNIGGLKGRIDSLSGEFNSIKKTIPAVQKALEKIKPKTLIYGKDWKLTREEIEQIADRIKPIVGRDFVQPKDGKDAEITDELISRIVKMVQDTVRDGRDGLDGVDGIDGKDGLDGSPDDPETIVDKLNMTEGGVDWKVLKNFDSLVNQETLKSAVQTLENQTRYLLQKTGTTGLTSVATDATLTGNGTSGSPLSVVGGITGTGVAGRVAFWSSATNISNDSAFLWDSTTNKMTISDTKFFQPSTGSIVIGAEAGNHTMTGVENLLFGGETISGFGGVGVSLTSGTENIFMGGSGVGRLITTGSRNVFIGNDAGSGTGVGVSDNVVLGRGAGSALGLSSNGNGNVIIGPQTGTGINANYVIAIGYQTGGSITASGVIAIGTSALSANTSGVNIGIGDSAGQNITTGTGNVLIGSIAGVSLITTSSNNTFIGYQTGTNNEGNRNTFVGSLAGTFPLGNDNTAIGYNTFNASGSGLDQTITYATVLGSGAMADPRTGSDYTTAIGYHALAGLTAGAYNTAVGANAGAALTLGIENTFVGMSAGAAMTGAQAITTGNFIGGMYASVNRTQGNFNTIIGTRTDQATSTGDSNTIYGYGAGAGLTSGASNIMIGALSGASITNGQGIFIGVGADGTASGVGQIAIGGVTTASNQFVVGSSGTPINNYFLGEGVTSASPSDITINATGGSGANTSGATMYLIAGLSTGNAIGGEVQICTSAAGASGSGANSAQLVLGFDGNGNLRAGRVHNNATAQGSASQQDIRSGTYTPTRSAETNLDANVTTTQAQWNRVGNTVTVSGRVTGVDPTLAATTTSFELTLPVSSNIGAVEDLAGVAFCGAVAGMGAEITGSVANNTAVITWKSSDITSQSWSYTFVYEVI